MSLLDEISHLLGGAPPQPSPAPGPPTAAPADATATGAMLAAALRHDRLAKEATEKQAQYAADSTAQAGKTDYNFDSGITGSHLRRDFADRNLKDAQSKLSPLQAQQRKQP